MERDALKSWTEVLTPWIQVLGLIAAGIFAVTEYLENKHQTKIQRAVDYLSRSSSEELVAARLLLSQREQANAYRFQELLQGKAVSQDHKNRAYFNFVVDELVGHGQKDGVETSFYRVLGFLEEGVTCSQGALCDEPTVKSALGDFGRSFIRTYTPYLCYLRYIWKDPSIGEHVEKFYNPTAAEEACTNYYESIQKIELIKTAASEQQP